MTASSEGRAYFDTSFLAKCYLLEDGSAEVRRQAEELRPICCSRFGRVELAAAIQRARRERRITDGARVAILAQWRSDDESELWEWLPISEAVQDEARRRLLELPNDLPLRASDAIHLATARLNGFDDFWSADVKQLAAAAYFGLEGRHV